MTERFQPTLLLSMPQLQDPNFAKTVVLLCDFVPEGAFGLVLNRPTDEPATRMVRLDPPVERGNDLRLHTGGPVEPDRGLDPERRRAGRRRAPDDRAGPVSVDVADSPCDECSRRVPRRVRWCLPAMRAGDRVSSIEELSQSAWLMCEVDLDLVFDTEPLAHVGDGDPQAWRRSRQRCRCPTGSIRPGFDRVPLGSARF